MAFYRLICGFLHCEKPHIACHETALINTRSFLTQIRPLALYSQTINFFRKNSSLITSARNHLTDKDITCDELNKQNVTKHHAQARQVIYGDVLQLQLITPQVSKNQQVTRRCDE
jgi:hypothetical protein